MKKAMAIKLMKRGYTKSYPYPVRGNGLFSWVRDRVFRPIQNFLNTNPAGQFIADLGSRLGGIALNAGATALTNKLPNKIFNQNKPINQALQQTFHQTINENKRPIFNQIVGSLGQRL